MQGHGGQRRGRRRDGLSEQELGDRQSGDERTAQLGDQVLAAGSQRLDAVEVAMRCRMRVRQSGAGVQRVVGGQPAARWDRQVVRHRADAEHVADPLGLRIGGLVDQAQGRDDDGVEEPQPPRQRPEGVGELDLLPLRGGEGLGRGDHVQVARPDRQHGDVGGGQEGEPGLLGRREPLGRVEVRLVHGAHVVGHRLAHRLGRARRRGVVGGCLAHRDGT